VFLYLTGFRSDLVDLIELDRKRSLSYVEDSANEDRSKHVLSLSKGCPENGVRKCQVIFDPGPYCIKYFFRQD